MHDTGEFEGRQYIVTELVDGGTLSEWRLAGARSWAGVVELLSGVADGVATAHHAGIVHRDVTPANILISKSGYAKLADFGLARIEESPSIAAEAATEARTRPGAIVGTVGYLPPEQATGREVDARSDVFSFAVVLYELLAGRRPFEGRTEVDVLHAIVNQVAEPLPPSIPGSLRTVIDKALSKDAADRPTMRELVAELRGLARHGEATAIAPPRTGTALGMGGGGTRARGARRRARIQDARTSQPGEPHTLFSEMTGSPVRCRS